MKKEICMENETFAVFAFSAFDGLELRNIEYGIDDYVYFVYISPNGEEYHKSKIYYSNTGKDYFRFNGHRVCFADCLRCF